MPKFTLAGSASIVTNADLYIWQTRRFRFHAGKPKVTFTSQMTKVAVIEKIVLFDGPQGIYTVDIKGVAAGDTSIDGKLSDNTSATLQVAVKAVPSPLELPAQSTEAGMLARLLLAETISPAYRSWTSLDLISPQAQIHIYA